jgi:ParB family chromosome partitioning protein
MVDRRLGRGLDFFLSGGRPQATGASPPSEEPTQLELGKLVPSQHQPRREFPDGELAELAASIRSSGILQPILVRRIGEGFEIVAGERRWRAAKLAGLERVPVLIKAITDDESAVFGLVENIQREDLNAIEKAAGFKKLLERFACSQEDVARRVGLDRSSIANFIRLLDLPHEVQAYVSRGTLSMGHARALLGVSVRENLIHLAEEAIRAGLSVRATEELVKRANLGPAPDGKPSPTRKRARPVWLSELEDNLVESLGAAVSIRYGKKRSQIVIDCAGREEFERIYTRLKGV